MNVQYRCDQCGKIFIKNRHSRKRTCDECLTKNRIESAARYRGTRIVGIVDDHKKEKESKGGITIHISEDNAKILLEAVEEIKRIFKKLEDETYAK